MPAGDGTDKKQRRRKLQQKVAVALKHDLERDDVPRVAATGRGLVAEKILKLAFEHKVKVRHDPDLAEVLSALEVEWEIPVEVFGAIAEILSYVYRANGIEWPKRPEDESKS